MPDWSTAARLANDIAADWQGGPGGAFVLCDAQGVRASACGGMASLEHGVPFTPDTANRYASISKHLLATCLLLQGTALDAPLAYLHPGLPPAIGAVPLVRALDMTGGLPDMMELQWQLGIPYTATLEAEAVFGILQRMDATCAPPGTEMAYSNTGWRLAQRVLEREAGQSYRTVLRDRLFGPLGLAMAFPDDETAVVPHLATGYWPAADGWRRGRYGMHISASGGVAGSAVALGQWAAALMEGRGPLGGVLQRLSAPRAFANGRASAYRLGLVETRLGGTRLLMHGGSLPGYRNHLVLAPDHGVAVVLLMNREADPLPLALRVMAALLGEAPPQPAEDMPAGLYAAADGPAWLELHPNAAEFMGARETLLLDGGRFRTVPGSLEMDLAITPAQIEGSIGGVARQLARVPDGIGLDPALVGTWRDGTFGTRITVNPDATAHWPWLGPVGQVVPLQPLPGRRALADLRHLMWRQRPCLWLDADDTLHLAGHRARVLRYRRD